MIEVPTDPVQELIDKASFWGRAMALSLANDYEKMNLGNMSNKPNDIVALGIYYEKLESEVPTNSLRDIARQLSRSIERTHKQLDPWLLNQRIRRLKKSAGQRLHRMS